MTGPPTPERGAGEDAEVGAVPTTGHARVDAVLVRAAELEAADVAEHPRMYEELHAALAAELEAEPGPVPPGPVRGPDPAP